MQFTVNMRFILKMQYIFICVCRSIYLLWVFEHRGAHATVWFTTEPLVRIYDFNIYPQNLGKKLAKAIPHFIYLVLSQLKSEFNYFICMF